jgi:K+-transporting ATPase ATPase C chain
MATGSQNYGPKSKLLLHFAQQQVAVLKGEGITPTNDLVTGSGSGIDPDISPSDAYDQVPAVAKADHLSVAVLDHLVTLHVVGAEWGFLGAPYIDVLELNEALAALR